MVDISIGNNCNSNCIMCTAIMPYPKKIEPPSTDQVIQTIQRSDDDTITITGGEPTLRDDIIYILKYINHKYPSRKIKIITNSRMYNYPEYLNNYSNIRI